MIGGTGNDTYTVEDVGDIVTEVRRGGYDTVNTTLASYKLGTEVERVNYTGTGNSLNVRHPA